jgi:uncharacterized membrane protein
MSVTWIPVGAGSVVVVAAVVAVVVVVGAVVVAAGTQPATLTAMRIKAVSKARIRWCFIWITSLFNKRIRTKKLLSKLEEQLNVATQTFNHPQPQE